MIRYLVDDGNFVHPVETSNKGYFEVEGDDLVFYDKHKRVAAFRVWVSVKLYAGD